ncbi:MAG TPA: hypothetical protein VJS66_08625 [Burkholderiales bacterium]|nr:hypothetical protein [Burkholderiales bacterium]
MRCGCGYCFDPGKLDGVTQELEVISQEEQLYRDYLAARAAQAEDEARVAKNNAMHEPANTVKSAEALLAVQTAMNARAELEAQDARATAVKNRIKVVRSSRRRKPKTAAPASVQEPLAPPAAAPAPHKAAVKPAAIAKPVTDLAPPIAPAPKTAARPVTVAKPVAALAPPMVTREIPQPVPQPAPVTRHVNIGEPTPAFRETQAAKAEQIAPPPPPKKTAGQDCPNCCAKVAPNAKHCRCGYELPSSANQMPALSMSPEDRAAMLAALGLNRETGG